MSAACRTWALWPVPHTPGRPVCPPRDGIRQSSRWGRCSQTHSWRQNHRHQPGFPTSKLLNVSIRDFIQLIDAIRAHDVREGGRGTSSTVVVVVAPPQRHHVLEADVRLRGVVHAVWDGYHGNGGEGGAACAHERT